MLASIGWAVMGVQPNAQICVNVKVHQESQEPMLEVLLKEGPCLLSYFCCCAFRKSPYLCYRCVYFFSNYTIHRRHSQRTPTYPYEYTHANPILRSIFEDCAGKSSRLTKPPQAPRCRRERRLPLKAQTPLNPEKFAPTGSRTHNLRYYQSSCNH
jgi:hypothetical protein